MKSITCPQCSGNKTFSSGPEASVIATWNCPKCDGVGELYFDSYIDWQLFKLAVKLKNLLNRYTHERRNWVL
jgi:hypothetical protein